MTRFARAEGSKASNKRIAEESTPWKEIKKQKLTSKLEKRRLKSEAPIEGSGVLEEKARSENEHSNNETSFNELSPNKAKMKNMKKHKKMSKQEQSLTQTDSLTGFPIKIENNKEESENVDKPKKKNKKELDINQNNESKYINNNSALKPSVSSTKKKLSADDDDVLNFELDNDDDTAIDSIRENTSKAKVKKQKECNNFVVENGKRFKVTKDGTRIPWFDIPYEENDNMTKYNKFFVYKSDVAKLNELKASLKNEGIDPKIIKKKLFREERKSHNRLRVHLLRQQIKNSKGIRTMEKPKRENEAECDVKYEENELMTQIDGYWIKRESVTVLDEIYEQKLSMLIKNRVNGDQKPELTDKEKLILRRQMKKERRREHRQLMLELARENKKKPQPHRPVKAKKYRMRNDNDMVKFDGFFIKKEAAERLELLRQKLKSKGLCDDEINDILRNERRKEERANKKEKSQFCFKCRQSGHLVSLCPENPQSSEAATDICFKCGSMEHMARECTSSKKGSTFAYASCFCCGQSGHIARECPDNPKGLYPRGGGCRECGSVEHLRRDCPELQDQKEKSYIQLKVRHSNEDIEGEDMSLSLDDHPTRAKQYAKPKAKHIIFD